MAEKLRYACIGAGGIARKKHVTGYSKLPQVKVVAICDTDRAMAEKLAQDFGVPKVYTDYRELLEKEALDIVSVCTPNFTHKEIALAALAKDCNVHLEKPIALNGEEAAAIVAAEQRSRGQVLMGMNKRYLSNAVLLRKLAEEGFFGELYSARCGWERSSGIPGIGRWFTDKALSGGGALIDLGVHYLDLTLSLMGWPEVSTVSGNTYTKFGKTGQRIRRGYRSDPAGVYDVEDMADGFIRTKDGKTVTFTFSWASNIEKEVRYVECTGTKGGFRITDDDLELYTQLGGTMFTLHPDPATMPLDMDECGHFVDCILQGVSGMTTAGQGMQVMQIIDGLYRSAGEGREISL